MSEHLIEILRQTVDDRRRTRFGTYRKLIGRACQAAGFDVTETARDLANAMEALGIDLDQAARDIREAMPTAATPIKAWLVVGKNLSNAPTVQDGYEFVDLFSYVFTTGRPPGSPAYDFEPHPGQSLKTFQQAREVYDLLEHGRDATFEEKVTALADAGVSRSARLKDWENDTAQWLAARNKMVRIKMAILYAGECEGRGTLKGIFTGGKRRELIVQRLGGSVTPVRAGIGIGPGFEA